MNILVSACLLGVCCRYDGQHSAHAAVMAALGSHCLIPVCPEILGGLATPRAPAERCGALVHTRAGEDVTRQYVRGAKEVLRLAQLYGCAHAILKERSPSCGSGMIYDGTFSGTLHAGSGVTAQLLAEHGVIVTGESQAKTLLQRLASGR